MASTIKLADLPNQIRLPYIEQGDSSGVPVVFLHGVAGSWRDFDLVLPRLAASIHAFALTQRGHSDASHPAAGYRLQHFAADLTAFFDTLDLQKAIVAGHSMGASVALRFAVDNPDVGDHAPVGVIDGVKDQRPRRRIPAEAAMSGDPEMIVQACAMDPLTSASLTLKEIRDMAIEMLEAEKQWLPQFEGKTIRPTPTIVIPKDVKRANVPVDPALAIMARFGELGK